MLTPRFLLAFLVLIGGQRSAGQNLVANGDFETHTGCPFGPNQLYMADAWINPSSWTPDYFHMCGTGDYSVPLNHYGFQLPHSDSAYAGIFLYNMAGFVREYIETPLLIPLTAGVTYHLELFVSLFDNARYSARNIGVYFSDTLVNSSAITLMPFTPQIVNTNPAYPDTASWYPVSGYYTAQGGESYLIIGNFDDDANTPLIIVNTVGGGAVIVHVDDVSLTLATGIAAPEEPTVQVAPVLFSHELVFTVPSSGPSEVSLFDLSSRLVLEERFTGSTRLGTSVLPSGCYIYAVRLHDGRTVRGSVVKE